MLAPAKLNLCLHVGPRRSDGYHDLFSLVAFADIGDALTMSVADETELIVEGPFASDLANLANEDNIVWVAASRVLELAHRAGCLVKGLRINLVKKLPVASGIGGGSSDAAAAIRLAVDCLQLHLSEDEMRKIGLFLGADVPVCLFGQTAWMSGMGDVLSRGPALPDVYVVLVNPGYAVSTKSVFDRFDRQSELPADLAPQPLPVAFECFDDLLGFLRTVRNDLEPPAKQIRPEIAKVLTALTDAGADLVRMSGSGATCFGLFSSKSKATDCRDELRLRYPQWWIDAGTLIGE